MSSVVRVSGAPGGGTCGPVGSAANRGRKRAAYSAGTALTGYVENVGVGDALPDMPIFLTEDRYVPCPLEATYQASWDAYPAALRVALVDAAAGTS